MKLIYPKQISQQRAETLRLCIAKSSVKLYEKEALSAVSNQLTSIETGVRIVGRNFPVPKVGKVDLVAYDQNGYLVLVNLNEVLNIQLVSRVLLQADWVAENREVLEHFYLAYRDSYLVSHNRYTKYPSTKLKAGEIRDTNNEIRNIRLWCMAGKILPEARSLLNHLDKNIQLEVFTYNCLVLLGERWIVVQKVIPSPQSINNDQRTTIHEIRDTRYELTQEEIDDFFSEDGGGQVNEEIDEEEITYVDHISNSA